MARGRRMKNFERPPLWASILLPVAALGVVGLALFGHGPAQPAYTSPAGAADTASPTAQATPPALQQQMALLTQTARPWTMTVLGDSTGATHDRWVYLLAQRMSAVYSRPVTLHEWSNDTASYSPPQQVGSGTGAAITIWNGSASGKDATYSLAYFATMAPAQPDLVIINHGLNSPTAAQATQTIQDLAGAVERRWPAQPALAVILQNPRFDDRAQVQEQIVTELTKAFPSSTGVSLIDVHAAFEANNPAGLVSPGDRYHPTIPGDALWASTVEQALGVPRGQ